MKIDRLIGILILLLQQNKATAPELAQRFEVSKRTINRDIEDLCKAGIPIITTQGYGGGISIVDGYKLEKSFFSEEEIHIISAGLKGMDSVTADSGAARILERLSSGKSRVTSEDAVIIDLASHYQASLVPKIAALKEAVRERHAVSFRYYYGKGDAVRIIEPYFIVFKWSSWYVHGYCTEKKAFRLFKLNRLWELKVLEETFVQREVPEEELSFEDYFEKPKIHLKAVFDRSQAYRLVEEYGVNSFGTAENGELLFEWDFAGYDYLLQWILSFGDKVTVIEPERLQSDRMSQAANILKGNNLQAGGNFVQIVKNSSDF